MTDKPISIDDARQSLQAAKQAERQIFEARSYGRAAPYLILWGGIWIVGFLADGYASPGHLVSFWVPLSIVGGLASGAIARRQDAADPNRERRAKSSLTGFAIFFYAALWPVLLHSHNPNRFGVYAGTLTGAAYLLGGLWAAPLIGWLGLAVTGIFLCGLLVDPTLFPIYAAIFGGGGLIATGLLLRRKEPVG